MKTIRVTLLVDSKGAVKGIADATGAVIRLDQQMDKAGKEAGRFGRVLDTTFGNFLAGIAVSAVQSFTRAAGRAVRSVFELARESASLAEIQSKFNTVFGASTELVSTFIEEQAKLLGLTKSQAQELLSTTGAILQGSGFTQKASAEASIAVAKLAGDLASFNDKDPAQVFRALQAAITGEREQLKTLGIVINQAEVDTLALANSANELGGAAKKTASELTAQEKATATLELITRKAGVAVGDLERTSTSTANQIKQITAEIGTLREELQEELAPAVSEVVQEFRDQLANPSTREAVIALGRLLADTIIFLLRFFSRIVNFTRLITIGVSQVEIVLNRMFSSIQEGIGHLAKFGFGAEEFGNRMLDLARKRDRITEAFRQQRDEQRELLEQSRKDLEEIGRIRDNFGGAGAGGSIPTIEGEDGDGKPMPEELKRLAEERERIRKEALDKEVELRRLRISLMKEGIDKELELIRFDFEEQKRMIQEKYPELAEELIAQADKLRAARESATLIESGEDAFKALEEANVEAFEEIVEREKRAIEEKTQAVEESTARIIAARLAEEEAERKKAKASEEASARFIESAILQADSVEQAARNLIAAAKKEITATLAKTIAEAIGTVPFPLNLVLGPGIALAIRGLFDAVLPGFAFGTDRAAGGLAIVGEGGPELVSLPGGASVLNNRNSMMIAEGLRAVADLGSQAQARPPRAQVDVRLGGEAVLRGNDIFVAFKRTESDRMETLGG